MEPAGQLEAGLDIGLAVAQPIDASPV